MRRLRPWALVLVLYVGADFLDPSIPGIFFFDHDQLFLDGVVQLKSTFSSLPSDEAPPGARRAWVEHENRPAPGQMALPVARTGPARWVTARRVPPPPSPDDH